MVATARELQKHAAHLRPVQTQEQAREKSDVRAATSLGRLDYERQYQGEALTERELFIILQKKMQEWEREGRPPEWQINYISGWHAAILADEPRRETTRAARDIVARLSHFGAFLKFLRERSHVKQVEVADEMPENHRLNRERYGKIEHSSRYYIHFDELATLYKALISAGVEIHAEERAAYLLLARQSIEAKTRKREHIHPAAWEALTRELASFDDSPAVLVSLVPPTPPPAQQPQEPQPQVHRLLLQVAGELGAMLTRIAALSQSVTGGTQA